MTRMTVFLNKVYEVVKQIPYGRVTSYGAIASYLGAPGAARMVGWAMNQSHTSSRIYPGTPGGEPDWTAYREASF